MHMNFYWLDKLFFNYTAKSFPLLALIQIFMKTIAFFENKHVREIQG